MLRRLVILALLLPMAACASALPFQSNVDGYAVEGFDTRLVHSVHPWDDAQRDDFKFAEFSAQTTRALQSAGIPVARDQATKPDILVFIAYGIGEPTERTSVVSLPMWGQTGVSSAQTTGTVGPGGTYNATTTFTPSYGVSGYSHIPVQFTTYTRHLVLTGYDLRQLKTSSEMKPVWKTVVVSEGSSGDLREVVPYMLKAAAPYLGKSTGRIVTVRVPGEDPMVARIRGGVGGGSTE